MFLTSVEIIESFWPPTFWEKRHAILMTKPSVTS